MKGVCRRIKPRDCPSSKRRHQLDRPLIHPDPHSTLDGQAVYRCGRLSARRIIANGLVASDTRRPELPHSTVRAIERRSTLVVCASRACTATALWRCRSAKVKKESTVQVQESRNPSYIFLTECRPTSAQWRTDEAEALL